MLSILVSKDDSAFSVLDNLYFTRTSLIEQDLDGHLDQFRNLDGAQIEGIRVGKEADKWGDDKVGDGHNVVQYTEDLDVIFSQSNLLKSLPEGGPFQINVVLVEDTSRKGDFSFVVFYLIGPLGKEDVTIPFFLKERNENSSAGKRKVLDPLPLPFRKDLLYLMNEIFSATLHFMLPFTSPFPKG